MNFEGNSNSDYYKIENADKQLSKCVESYFRNKDEKSLVRVLDQIQQISDLRNLSIHVSYTMNSTDD